MTETYRRDDLSIDQRLALKTAAFYLADEFSAHFGVETIDRFLHSSYDELARTAVIIKSCRCSQSGSLASGCAPWPRWKA